MSVQMGRFPEWSLQSKECLLLVRRRRRRLLLVLLSSLFYVLFLLCMYLTLCHTFNENHRTLSAELASKSGLLLQED